MSQSSAQQNNNKILQKLPNQWTLWFSYSSDQQSDINYGNNLMKIQRLIYWNDFALIWSWTSKTQKFFMNTDDGTYNKFKFGTEQRKIDSINFFKYDNQPQWEYGNNPKYGYFNFNINRNDQRINDIFEATVFLALGGTQQIAQKIIGIRIVDLGVKPNHPSRARIQIWVDFRHDNSKQSIQKISYFQGILQKYYYDKIQFQINQFKFFNISRQEDNQVKTPNKNSSQNYKGQGNRNNNKKYKKN